MAKRNKRGRESASVLARFDTAALVSELDRRRVRLQFHREELQAEIQEVEQAIADLSGEPEPRPSKPGRKSGGRGKPAGQRRGRAGVSLADAMASALSGGGAKSVPDLIAAVRRSGYRSSSPNFRSMVSQRLVKDGRFKRVSRGVYLLK